MLGGYFTATLLAVHPWYTYISHTGLPDGFALARWAYILAGVSAAMTMLARLQAFTIFIPVGTAHLLYWWKQPGRPLKVLFTRWLWSLGSFALTGILFNPFIILDWEGALRDIRFITGQYGGDSPLSDQLTYTMQNIDLPAIVARPYILVASGAGLLIALARRRHEVLISLLFAILFTFSILPRAHPTPNFFLPLIIPATLAAGYAVTVISESKKRWIRAGGMAAALILIAASSVESILADRALAANNTRMEAYEWAIQNISTDAAILIGEPYAYSVPLERNEDSLQRLSRIRTVSPSEQFILENPPFAREPRFDLFGPEYQTDITDDDSWWEFTQLHEIEYVIEADYCAGPFRYDSASPIEFPVLSESVHPELILLATFSPFASDTCEQHIPERLHLQRMQLWGWQSVGPLIRVYRIPEP